MLTKESQKLTSQQRRVANSLYRRTAVYAVTQLVVKRRSERLALGPANLLQISKIIAGVKGSFLETGFARPLLATSSTFLTNLESQGL